MQPSICLAIHGFIGRPFLPRAPAFLHASAGSPAAAVLAAVLHAQAALILTSLTHPYSLSHFSGLLACLLAHLTCNITHSLSRHTTKLASILNRISFVTSDTDRDTIIYISAATPSTSSWPDRSQSPDSPALHIAPPIAFHHPRTDFTTSAPRDTLKPDSGHPVVEATAC
jgi:hypothetical protein